jgi:tetratricopeptide (TPR) repeat protein
VARAAQKSRKREKANAERRPASKRSNAPIEQTLFFNRLRAQAKWMFVFLALVFGVGFIVFGVGGGIPGTSLGDILRDNSNTSGPSQSALEERLQKNPRDAEAANQLAQQQQQDGDTKDAIQTLENYTKVAPKDASALSQLGSLYLLEATNYSRQAQAAQTQFQAINPGAFIPSLTGSTGQPLITNPLTDPAAQEASTRFNEALSNTQGAYDKAVSTFERITKATPNDAQAQLQLAQTAQQAGAYEKAIAAYQEYLKLSPEDQNAAVIRNQIKQLKAQLKRQAAQAPVAG